MSVIQNCNVKSTITFAFKAEKSCNEIDELYNYGDKQSIICSKAPLDSRQTKQQIKKQFRKQAKLQQRA